MTLTFPAVYNVASNSSAAAQTLYLRLLRTEYGLLFIAAVLSMNFSQSRIYMGFYALTFAGGLVCLLYRSLSKPEQAWYKARALAESVKTSTWRYAMRAQPYGSDDGEGETRKEFRQTLFAVIKDNEFLGELSDGKNVADLQVTPEMNSLRSLDWRNRLTVYHVDRITDQRRWYEGKASWNKKAARTWTGVGVAIYVAGIGCVIAKIVEPQFAYWPESPLIFLASAAVGWVQIKKFRELASSYSLTALEIGVIEAQLYEIANESEFVAFVNDAEQAFSREHTQWKARQQQN